jgi:glycine betaine/choline ABC-type transport system substrate-binding protein
VLSWAVTIQPAASISTAQISYAMTEQKKQKRIKEWRKNLEKLVFLTNKQRNKRVSHEIDKHIAKRTKLSTCSRLATHFQ